MLTLVIDTNQLKIDIMINDKKIAVLTHVNVSNRYKSVKNRYKLVLKRKTRDIVPVFADRWR